MKIAILTNFQELTPGYSLTGIVTDQVKMLVRYGHDVHLHVSKNYNPKNDHLLPYPDKIHVHRTVPHFHLKDHQNHESCCSPSDVKNVEILKNYLREVLKDTDIAFTHDWVFTGWNLPFAMALTDLRDETRHVGFMHWVHSIPSGQRDWWRFELYGNPGRPWPTSLPANHFLICPSECGVQQLAEEFRCLKENVRTIPHIKDPRTWFEFGEDTEEFLSDNPGVMQADIVTVYPASCDRLSAKQLQHVIAMIAAMKRRCLTVSLICANQWATGRQRRESIDTFYEVAEKLRLVTRRNKPDNHYAEEFIFTSDFQAPKYELGIPRRMLRELMLLSNLFVFPTREESFGLVAPEAALCGNFMVMNRDLPVLPENFLNQGLYFSFGSLYSQHNPDSWENYIDNIAMATLSRMRKNEVTMTKTYARQRFNMDFLYHRAYEPTMKELIACHCG